MNFILMSMFIAAMYFSLFSANCGWILTMSTIDRLIRVCLPFRSMTFCTVANAKKITAVVVILILLLTLPMLFLVKPHKDEHGEKYCRASSTYVHYAEWVLGMIGYAFLPSVLMPISNLIMVYKLTCGRE